MSYSYKAGDSYARFAADMEDFLNDIDKYYDAIISEGYGAGSFYHYLGDDRDDRDRRLNDLSKYLTHAGMDNELLATLENAVEAFERISSLDRSLTDKKWRGLYPTREIDSLYVFAYDMIKDVMYSADTLAKSTPATLAYMGITSDYL